MSLAESLTQSTGIHWRHYGRVRFELEDLFGEVFHTLVDGDLILKVRDRNNNVVFKERRSQYVGLLTSATEMWLQFLKDLA
jgi:hypothetical protein